MDDSNQIHVPPSFTALFTARGGHRLKEPIAHVRERYELCEDLAQMLTEQAAERLHALGVTEQDVLARMRLALATGPDSVVSQAEALWVVQRLAEVLGWPALVEPPTEPEAR